MTIEQFLEQLKKLDRAAVKRKIETTQRKQAKELRLSLERQERRLVGGAIERYQQLFDRAAGRARYPRDDQQSQQVGLPRRPHRCP